VSLVTCDKLGKKNTGDFMASFQVEFRMQQYGTAPHYVSPRVLAPWAEKKGLNPFAVSKSIQKKGTKANPFFADTVEYSEKGIDRIFKDALTKITKEIV
jgi:hypothetical protein